MIDKLLLTCLQRNKRLVVPTLGAFIRKSVDGVGVILVFVPFLNKDDGVLLNAFKEWAGVTKDEAQAMLDEYVAHIKSTLETRGGYVIDGIGVLKYDANNSLYLAKDGLPKTPEKIEEKETKTVEKIEVKEAPQPEAPKVVEQLASVPVEQVISTINVAPEAPQPSEVAQPTANLNSQFTTQQTANQNNSSLNNQFVGQAPQQQAPAQLPVQEPVTYQNEETTLNVQQPQPTYKKVVTGGEGYHNQRGNSNIGDFYFNGGEGSNINDRAATTAYQQNEQPQHLQQPQQPQQQPQVAYPYQSQPEQPQQPSYRENNPQNMGARPAADKNKVNALYASNKRPAPSEVQNQRRTPPQRKPTGKRPVKAPTKRKSGQKMSFSAKLIWILAIVAIILTVSVIVYAIIYGGEVSLPANVQPDNIETNYME
ncbi:MAG: hypothetical protein R3Y51_01340 [Rikenellaceae bacterium]